MLYNLIILNAESGMSLATIKLSESGFGENEGTLMSGVVQAITQFLQELKIGQIQNFVTLEKQVILLKYGSILVALICDLNENSEIYLPKIKYIARLFESKCDDWSCWDGEVTMFNDIIQQSERILKISDEELNLYFHEKLVKAAEKVNEILGFRIYLNMSLVSHFIREIDDFELYTFLSSDMIDSFVGTGVKSVFKDALSDLISQDTIQNLFVDYEQFSVLGFSIGSSFFIIVFLPGRLDPLTDVERIIKQIRLHGGFDGF